jgi:hypothetical protein
MPNRFNDALPGAKSRRAGVFYWINGRIMPCPAALSILLISCS